ncbi:zeta toxin family protein [Botryobacter ruber]|uniref:zeta toxin family protein n=1 Tax=Botryobacter ruber TaxID=2171629 RepID=UPI000E0C363A|nr:zeta toxin family protein [Botryobacter ruber]
MSEKPRLRMFAGPNGSGKSELKKYVSEKLAELKYDVNEFLGQYINADELLKELRQHPFLLFTRFNLPVPSLNDFISFFTTHPLADKKGLNKIFESIKITEAAADFSDVPFFPNSSSPFEPDYVGNYLAAILADWLRQRLTDTKQSFSFETVMSGEDKVRLLEKARQAGYRTYLYFVTTKDVLINIGRVHYRVTQGGHDVPEKNIRDRYTKSLQHLKGALQNSTRAYLFDNSTEGEQPVFIAELIPEGEIIYHTNELPEWYLQYVEGQEG